VLQAFLLTAQTSADTILPNSPGRAFPCSLKSSAEEKKRRIE
jgi:hypothetical protein